MLNFQRLEDRVCADEGFVPCAYLDSVGVPTIGYGTTCIMGAVVTMDTPPITSTEARDLLRSDLFTALIDAQAIFANLDLLNNVRQEVLVNMAYNMGRGRLLGFSKMIANVNLLQYEKAADEMVDSVWYRQTKKRAQRLVKAMRSGVW